MDRREATRVIKELLADRDNDSRYPCVSSPRHYEALDLAIEALVLQDKYVKALERTIEGAKEINKFLEEATAPGNQKQVTSKLKKPCDSLLTADSDECKEQKSKLDCISRQEAIEDIKKHANTITDALIILENFPPVTPTERTGEWVSHELWDMPWFTCSECNYHGRSDFKFCPNCGADMRGDK